MGLNSVIAELACTELKRDDTLYEAIVTADMAMVRHLVNGKYKMKIINSGFVKEAVSIGRLTEIVESILDGNRGIRLIC